MLHTRYFYIYIKRKKKKKNKRTVTLFFTLFRYFLNLDNRISREREKRKKEEENIVRIRCVSGFSAIFEKGERGRERERETRAQFRSTRTEGRLGLPPSV